MLHLELEQAMTPWSHSEHSV